MANNKFEISDIETIIDCIQETCNKTIEDRLNEFSYTLGTAAYKIRRDNILEAERLIALMDSLKKKASDEN